MTSDLQYSHPSFAGFIGLARQDITPPPGIYARNWGAAAHDVATGVHRPLFLTALTLQTEAQSRPLVLVDADLGWWRSLLTERRFRRRLLDELGLEEEGFIFALSHTHSAPPLSEPEPDWPGSDLLSAYLERVYQAAVDAVLEALRSAAPARLAWHTGRCGLATNRDLADPAPDRERFITGFHPHGEADDTLLIGRVTDADGTIRATLVNYASHPTTLAWENRLLSPDYVGAMREVIESHTGGALALFLQGASGELAPRYQYVDDPAVADAHGRQLGFAALATLTAMEPPGVRLVYDRTVESGAPLAVWRREPHPASGTLQAQTFTIELPLQAMPSADELERQRQACADRAQAERLRRKRDVRRALGDGSTFPLQGWVWQIGEALLLGTMCECYSWIQRELRRRFPQRTLVYLNLINGSIGYLPPAELYGLDLYQVWQSPFDRGSLEMLADAFERAVRDSCDP